MPVGDILPELLLLGGGVIVLLYALFARRHLQALAAGLASLVLASSAAATVMFLESPRD